MIKIVFVNDDILIFNNFEDFYSSNQFSNEKVKEVYFDQSVRIKNANRLFYNFKNLEKFTHYPENFESCSDMSFMFGYCYRFNQELTFNKANVTNLSGMFCNCSSFDKKLFFNKEKLKQSTDMFHNCWGLS